MGDETWAGRSGRDLLVSGWFAEHLLHDARRVRGTEPLVLLGGHGSGKSSLLDHLHDQAQHTYRAQVDCEQLGDDVQGVVDLLARVVFQLSAEIPSFPRLQLPAYVAVRLALATERDAATRETTLQTMDAALNGGQGEQRGLALFVTLVEKLAPMAGLPPAVSGALPLLAELLRSVRQLRTRRVLKSLLGVPAAAEDFLVGVGHGFQHGSDRQRRFAEAVLMRAFVDDLRRAYTTSRGHEKRTLRCALLLDNVDDPRGRDFLTAFNAARLGAADGDVPVVMVASARRRPALLEPADLATGELLGCWQRTKRGQQERFVPSLVARRGARVRVAQLRPLSLEEIRERCRPVARALPDVDGLRRQGDWLARVVHELTSGQPYATAAVLDGLRRFEDQEPLVTRLRRLVDPDDRMSVIEDVYERLFGSVTTSVARYLPRVAASVDPVRALTAEELWGPGTTYVRDATDALARDDLHCDVVRIDGRVVTVLPAMVRRMLLHHLAENRPRETDHGPGTWIGAHRALRGDAHDRGTAYHLLAAGDVAAAARYLHDLLCRVAAGNEEPDVWCSALSWIQRAPLPGALREQDPVEEYDRRVGLLPADLPGEQLPIARLLIAGQLTLHPREDPYAQLWSDPVADPTARLRGEIVDQLNELRGRLTYQQGLPLRDRIQTYEGDLW